MARYVFGKSVKGASHVRSGMPCQDSFKIQEISDNFLILAVADGHGSEKSPRSATGSRIATNVFYDTMSQYLISYKMELPELVKYLNRDGEIRFAQDICDEWQRRIKISFSKSKDPKPLDDEGNVKWDEVYKLYGTTLLGLLVSTTHIFAFQIGDGDMVCVDKDDVTPIVETEKILGTETHSLSKTDAWKKAVSVIRRRDMEADVPYLYMISTDGFANSHISDAEYYKTCRDYYDMIREHGFDKVCGNMEKWLNETSELGCGDDITLVMVYVE